jgi:hypothetical protein
LRAEGCDGMQGYLFSPPVPAGEFAALLAKDRREQIGASRPARPAAGAPEPQAAQATRHERAKPLRRRETS